MNPAEESALAVARTLAQHGVPIFIARPAMKDGQWDPTGGHNNCGYWLPKGWETTSANPRYLEAWRPGMAVCAVMGRALDLVDLDPRNGGNPASLNGTMPTVYGVAATPSEGWHRFVKTLGVRSRDNVLPGIDIKAGDAAGIGRGFAFIAPTIKLSKSTGELGHYRWERPPDPDQLEQLSDDHSGEKLAEIVRRAHGTRNSQALNEDEGVAREWLIADAIPRGSRYPWLRSYAGWMREKNIRIAEARILMRQRWKTCEQPTDYQMPWVDAEQLLEDIYSRYAPGQAIGDEAPADQAEIAARRIVLTAASTIHPRRVKWAWDGRLALGTLGLLAGPEGLGKSTLAYWLAARITRGDLPGEYIGQPRAVLVCATEDSWAHTIVPRLMAAGANLELVHRVEVKSADDITLGLSLPRDIHDLDQAAQRTNAALLILDPLMSRISEALDTHRDGDVRRALEPMVGIADHTGMAIIGLIHHNKSGSSDPLQLVMASKAFTAVARSVHTVIKDPDDETETRRLFGTPKNNLGRTDLPVMSFTITGWVYDTADGLGTTGQLVWGEDIGGTIGEALRRANDDPENRTVVQEAAEWLVDYLFINGPRVASADIRKAAGAAGHSYDAVKRARRKMKIPVENEGMPRKTYWVSSQWEQTSRGDAPTALTTPTGQTRTGNGSGVSTNIPPAPLVQSGSRSSESTPPRGCSHCGTPLDQHAAPNCPTPVIHRPPDLWS
jgi:AAA domain